MRKTIIGITSALLFATALPAGANVPSDPVPEKVWGRCIGENHNAVTTVQVVVVAPGATSLSVTCHVIQQTPWGERDGHVGAVSLGAVAVGAAVIDDGAPDPFEVCTEIHVTYPTGPPYHTSCH
jgi:hypothetical protein